jgi:ferredoxin
MSSEPDAFTVSFAEDGRTPVRLGRGAVLSEHLTIANSPVLFGCRTGICGTCLVEVEAQSNGELEPPSPDEQEMLELFAPDNARARLACQIALRADIRIRYLGKYGR